MKQASTEGGGARESFCLADLTNFDPFLVPLGLIDNVDVRSHENNWAHRTKEIDQKRLIVRRGQPFAITLQCTDSLPTGHYLELVLHLGE